MMNLLQRLVLKTGTNRGKDEVLAASSVMMSVLA
jgi:hypothetical protein